MSKEVTAENKEFRRKHLMEKSWNHLALRVACKRGSGESATYTWLLSQERDETSDKFIPGKITKKSLIDELIGDKNAQPVEAAYGKTPNVLYLVKEENEVGIKTESYKTVKIGSGDTNWGRHKFKTPSPERER